MKALTNPIVNQQMLEHKNVKCSCGKVYNNVYVTSVRQYALNKFVYINHKALPMVCDKCKTSFNMEILTPKVCITKKLELSLQH
jgi:hypothetical protein